MSRWTFLSNWRVFQKNPTILQVFSLQFWCSINLLWDHVRCPTQKLDPIGLVVLTIIGYKQTNKQTDRQAKYTCLRIGRIVFFLFLCFRTNLNDLESRNETRPGNAEGSFMFSKGWNSEDDMFATLSSPKMESATQACLSFKYSILVKHLSNLIWL